MVNPVVTVEVGAESFTAQARVTEGEERDRLWAEHVAAHPGIDAFDEWPARVIPVVVLTRLGYARQRGPEALGPPPGHGA